MDETDRPKTAATLETVRTGVPSTWRNPDTGNEYVVTPTKTLETASGPCREYTIDAVVGGKKEKVYGTACRQPDAVGTCRVDVAAFVRLCTRVTSTRSPPIPVRVLITLRYFKIFCRSDSS